MSPSFWGSGILDGRAQWSWREVSPKTAGKMMAAAAVILRSSWVRNIHFQGHSHGQWQEFSVPSWLWLLSSVPYHMSFFKRMLRHGSWLLPREAKLEWGGSHSSIYVLALALKQSVLVYLAHTSILIQCGREFHKDMNTKWWGSLGTILETAITTFKLE